MIGIKLLNQEVFLGTLPDTTIDLTLKNPLLGDAQVLSPGSYSLPFDLPSGDSSPKNAQAFNHPDVMENSSPYQLQKADLYVDEVLFKSGNLKIASIEGPSR